MGREIKRVALDFDFPLGDTWTGYLLPEKYVEAPCPDCCNGETPARAWVGVLAHQLLMLDDDREAQRRGRRMHPYFESLPAPHGNERTSGAMIAADVVRPSADIRELGTGLAGREAGLLGHSSSNDWTAEKKIIEAAGLNPDTWGICTTCDGHALIERYEGQRNDAETWEREEPPAGDGWQLWQTVSEGGPISPVFATDEELAQWMASDAYRYGISTPLPIEQARKFVQTGWAASMVFTPATGLVPGEAFDG